MIDLFCSHDGKEFYDSHNGKSIEGFLPIGVPMLIRRDCHRMMEDIGSKAPKDSGAYCIGWDYDNVFRRDGVQMVPIQYFFYL